MKKLLLIIALLISALGLNAQDATIGDLEFTVISETLAECKVSGCSGEPVNVIIPSKVTILGKEYTVIFIGSFAFSYCDNLTSIEFGENSQLTSIGDHAFYGCSSLTSIEFGENSQLTSIVGNAFSGCSSLTSIEFGENSQLTSIGDYAFSYCDNLTSIEFGENSQLTSIGDNAFYGCSSLTSIEIPSSVTSIGSAAFCYCSSLTSIEIPSGVTSIGDYAFSGCSSLTSIVVESGNTVYDSRDNCNAIIETATNTLIVGCQNTFIPNIVTSIGSTAFSDCSSLTSIEIPSYVTSIGSYAFSGCSSLTSIYCYAETVPATSQDAFSGCPSNMVIYVPAISVNVYKVTSPWKNYTIIALPCVVTASANPEDAGIITGAGEYTLNDTVTLTATANEGYRFVSWTENNNLVSIDKEYSFVVANHRNLVANFEKTYEITATVNPEKVGVVMGKGVYSHGDNVTLVAIPVKTGYEFVNWTEDGEVVSEDVEYSFVATSDRELIANFVLLDYYVSAVANAAEAGEILGSGNYNHGEDVTLTAVANEGYKFVNWTEDGEVISENTQYSFVIIKDRNLVANFEKLEDPEQPGEGVEELTSSFNIYPNPVSDKLYIETEVEIEEVSIFDIYGRRQELSVISCQPSAIDVSGLNSGVYFVKVVTSEGEAMKRIVKK